MNVKQCIASLTTVVWMLNFINVLDHIPYLMLYQERWWFLQKDEYLLSSSEMHIASLLG